MTWNSPFATNTSSAAATPPQTPDASSSLDNNGVTQEGMYGFDEMDYGTEKSSVNSGKYAGKNNEKPNQQHYNSTSLSNTAF